MIIYASSYNKCEKICDSSYRFDYLFRSYQACLTIVLELINVPARSWSRLSDFIELLAVLIQMGIPGILCIVR